MADHDLDELCINTIRFLAVDAVEKAKSGHPGAPMGAASFAYVLWDRFLRHNPSNASWLNRDRFVLSAGHASALLYSLLHLTGYDLPLDELKRFRQLTSKTPGHPEFGIAPGVESTTGPLGQGFANGVGMAIAERWLSEKFNHPGYEIIDHRTYGIVSDGDVQEGVASEAASLAGHLKLNKLIYFYDDNGISIEGKTQLAFSEDVAQRFRSYGWHVVDPIDGLNLELVNSAIKMSQQSEFPSLIICKSIIGYGSPNKANTASAHGEPLGEDEVLLAKDFLKWSEKEPFWIPNEALSHFRLALIRGKEYEQEWVDLCDNYREKYPDDRKLFDEVFSGELPDDWSKDLGSLFNEVNKVMATREASGLVMNAIAKKVHTLIGGSADLAPSNKTNLNGLGDFGNEDYGGRNLHFGVREHAMGAIGNGMALHGGVIPYVATFLIFSDYMRPPMRLAAMMGQRVIYVFTHDSIGLGEDGPTHQPIEQLMSLRMVPNMVVIRPADASEVAEAWKIAINRRDGPTVLILSRQGLPVLDRSKFASASGLLKGGYVIWESQLPVDTAIIATGSEVHLALEAGNLLESKGIGARVISLASWELFETQSSEYIENVLPASIRYRVSVEAGIRKGWERYVGRNGLIIGLDGFGASAPYKALYSKFGLTADDVVKKICVQREAKS